MPTAVQAIMPFQNGNSCLVTCARIMRPTWYAKPSPQKPRNGTNVGESMRDGRACSQATSIDVCTTNGSRPISGV